MKTKLIKCIGSIATFASFIYIGRTIWENYKTISWSFDISVLLVLTVHIFFTIGGSILYAFLYQRIISNIAEKMIINCLIMPRYIEANLYKYLPGNIMHYVGRNRIATDGSATYEQVNLASILEVGISALSSLCLGIFFSGSYFLTSITCFVRKEWILIIIIAGLISGIICLTFFRKRLVVIGKLLRKRNTIQILSKTFIIYSLYGIVGQYIFVVLIRAIGGNVPEERVLQVIGISALAWLIGFMTPGAPGGIGVREAMLQLLLSGIIPAWIITAAGVLTRLTQVLGEILSFLIIRLKYNSMSKGDLG